MLEVAVIGAGGSALAASRHLLLQGLRPSIFEASKTLGGAWRTSHNVETIEQEGKMWDGMCTNLSKHTCRFSDWPWPADTPTFPSATDMHRYLESYAEQFLDPNCFQFQCQVTNVELIGQGNQGDGYRVEWTDLSTSTTHSKDFTGVVIATGFFAKPSYPSGLDLENPKVQNRVLHSSDYKSSAAFVNETVAIVGSSFSAFEIAADVSKTAKKVISVVPSIPWVLPRYIPQQPTSHSTSTRSTILPIDLALYRRTKDYPELPETVEMTDDLSQRRHAYLHSIIGKRQELTTLGIPQDWSQPPMVAISDRFLDLVMQGDIEILHGRFHGLHPEEGSSSPSTVPTWEVESPTGQSIALRDVDKVICSTGFKSDLGGILAPEILDILDFNAEDQFCPMTTCWDTLHPELPNLFFCGMYRGPYMGIVEMQGRLASQVLSQGGEESLSEAVMSEALEVSKRRRQQTQRPQFPHFDYVGFLDTLNGLITPERFPKIHTKQGDMVGPAFYQEDIELAEQEAVTMEEHMQKGLDGSQIPTLVMSAIIGAWDFDRRIVHFSNNRHEHVYGAVKYTRPDAGDHVLYREDGFYELSPTKTLNVFREYEYEVNNNCLELYFVEGGERAHLFLSLKFTPQTDRGDYWVATSDHLCIKDLYQANFRVRLDGMLATELQMTYRVKGPAKDYESTTILTRRKPDSLP